MNPRSHVIYFVFSLIKNRYYYFGFFSLNFTIHCPFPLRTNNVHLHVHASDLEVHYIACCWMWRPSANFVDIWIGKITQPYVLVSITSRQMAVINLSLAYWLVNLACQRQIRISMGLSSAVLCLLHCLWQNVILKYSF